MPGPMGGMGAGMPAPAGIDAAMVGSQFAGSIPNPFGSPIPGGGFAAATDCTGMAMVRADPSQPQFLRDQIVVAMRAGGCPV